MLNIHCMNFFTQQQLLLRHLLGLGNKSGVKIISTTKNTLTKNLHFPPLMVIDTNLEYLVVFSLFLI